MRRKLNTNISVAAGLTDHPEGQGSCCISHHNSKNKDWQYPFFWKIFGLTDVISDSQKKNFETCLCFRSASSKLLCNTFPLQQPSSFLPQQLPRSFHPWACLKPKTNSVHSFIIKHRKNCGPIDPRSTRLSYILQDVFRDTPLEHIWLAQICTHISQIWPNMPNMYVPVFRTLHNVHFG